MWGGVFFGRVLSVNPVFMRIWMFMVLVIGSFMVRLGKRKRGALMKEIGNICIFNWTKGDVYLI